MPKMKTHKGIKKRFKITGSGKAVHRASGTSHLNTRLSKKRRRNLRGTRVAAECNEATVQRALGKYGR